LKSEKQTEKVVKQYKENQAHLVTETQGRRRLQNDRVEDEKKANATVWGQFGSHSRMGLEARRPLSVVEA